MAVHRYKANESGDNEDDVSPKKVTTKTVAKSSKKTVAAKTAKKSEKSTKKGKKSKVFAPFRALKDYFVGSWYELRQVRWPNRKQTWALTLAVLLFSLFFGVLIFLLDAGFTLLFKKFIF